MNMVKQDEIDKKISLTGPEYSTVLFSPFLTYLEKNLGKDKANEIINKTGLPWDYLTNESNLVSQQYADSFYDVLDTAGLPDDYSFQSALMLFNKSKESLFVSLAIQFSYPDMVYKNLINISQRINKVDTITINELSSNSMKITFISKRETRHMKHIANSWAAPFQEIPTLFGLPKANVKYEIKDKIITFNIKWTHICFFSFLFIAKTVTFICSLISIVLAIFIFFAPFITLSLILMSLSYFLSLLLIKKKNSLKKMTLAELESYLDISEKKSIELYSTVQKLDRRYKEANLLSGVIKRISESHDLQRLTEITTQEIHQTLKYDRVVFFVLEGDYLIVKDARGFEDRLGEMLTKYKLDLKEVTANISHLGNIFKLRSSIIIPTTSDYFESLSDEGKFLVRSSGSKSFLAASVHTKDESYGVLLVDYCWSDKKVNNDDLHIIKNIANQLAISFSHVTQLEKERFIRTQFQSYVPQKITEEIFCSDKIGQAKKISPHLTSYHEITTIFSDIRNYTDLAAEKTTQEEEEKLCRAMNYYFERMAEIVYANNGIIDKHIGDAIFIIFNAFKNDPYHKINALEVAYQMQLILDDTNQTIRKNIDPQWKDLKVGISIHTGNATLGSFGSRLKKEFTAMGNTINIGSRVEGLCKIFGESVILITEELVSTAENSFEIAPLGDHSLKGIKNKKPLFKIIGRKI